MIERTYTLNADVCDEWVRRAKTSAYSYNWPMLEAIKAQQPKPRIKWEQGLKVRDNSWLGGDFTCVRPTTLDGVLSGAPERLLLAWDNVVHATWPGFDGESFDPEVWEVIK